MNVEVTRAQPAEVEADVLAVPALDASEPQGLQTAAARVVRAQPGGGTLAWALDDWLPLAMERQMRALVEGAVLGGYDPGRWKSDAPASGLDRFVVCGADEDELRAVAARAELVAR